MNNTQIYRIIAVVFLFNYVAFAMEKPPLVQQAVTASARLLIDVDFTKAAHALSKLSADVAVRIQDELIKKYGFLALQKCGVPKPEEHMIGLSKIESLATNPAGTLALSASKYVVGFWDITAKPFHTIGSLENTEDAGYVSFSPNGKYALAIDNFPEKPLLLWEIGKQDRTTTIRPLPAQGAHNGYITAVVWSGDGRFAITGTDLGIIQLWDLEKRPIVAENLPRDVNFVRTLALSPHGDFALSDGDGSFMYWDLRKRPVTSRVLFDRQITLLKLSPDGKSAITVVPKLNAQTGEFQNQIRLWDLTKEPMSYEVLGLESNQTMDLHITEDGRLAFAISFNPASGVILLSVWDLKGRPIRKLWSKRFEGIADLRINADGSRALTFGHDLSIKLWDLMAPEELSNPVTLANNMKCALSHAFGYIPLALNADGTLVLFGDNEGRLWAWDLSPLETLTPLQTLLVVRLLLGQDLSGNAKAQEIKKSIATLVCPTIGLEPAKVVEPVPEKSE